jgi:hypothetical protein
MSLLMPFARFKSETGDVQYVRPQGHFLQNGQTVYYEALHKNHLECPCCDTPVLHRKAAPVIASGHKGFPAFFATFPRRDHEDSCPLPREKHDRKIYDQSRGYRIHVNLPDYSDLFNHAAGPYERDENNRLRLKDQMLATRQPKAVSGIEDVVKLIRSGDFARLKDSVVMLADREQPLSWNQFLIRLSTNGGTHNRHLALMDRALSKLYQPAVVEIEITDKTWPNKHEWRAGKLSAQSKPIFAGRFDNKAEWLIPRIWLDNPKDTRVQYALCDPGHYLVLGIPRVSKFFGQTRFLDISVTDHRQVMQVDFDSLIKQGESNAARTQTRSQNRAAKEAPAI